MKKYIIVTGKVLAALIFSTTIYAQNNTATTPDFKMGIIVGSGINIGNATNTSLMQNAGLGYNLSIGMALQKTINQNLSFNTGLEFDFDKFSYKSQNADSLYYFYANSESRILTKEEYNDPKNTDYLRFTLENRDISTIYLTIPTMLTGKTNMIGKNAYFARIGLRHSFLIKETINDNGRIGISTEKKVLEGFTSPKELSFYKLNLGMSVGTEWNFIGNSFLVLEMGYFVGITNIHQGESIFGDDKQKDMSLILGNKNPKYTTVKGTQNQLLLKATFLF